MDWNGIMNATTNPFCLQKSAEFIAFLEADCINVIDMPRVIRLDRRGNVVDACKRFIVEGGALAPQQVCLFEMAQFNGQDRRLDAVHPAIPSYQRVVVFSRL